MLAAAAGRGVLAAAEAVGGAPAAEPVRPWRLLDVCEAQEEHEAIRAGHRATLTGVGVAQLGGAVGVGHACPGAGKDGPVDQLRLVGDETLEEDPGEVHSPNATLVTRLFAVVGVEARDTVDAGSGTERAAAGSGPVGAILTEP